MKSIFFTTLTALAVTTGLWAAQASAQTELSGRDGLAYYKILVPDVWNGGLVIWNHGFSFEPPGAVSDLGPLVDLQLDEGYAVAASSYSQDTWALFRTANDLERLVAVFQANFGAPSEIIVTGASLGGIVTAQAIEKAELGNVTGAFTFCGAVAGSRNWDGALDIRLTYDTVCASTPGAALPGGATGLPADSNLTSTDVTLAADACFGILSPPDGRTPQQTENLARFLKVTQLPESFVITDMVFSTLGLADLVHDRSKLRGRIGAGNANVFYDDPEIDPNIERVSPDPVGAFRLRRNFTPSGDVGNVRHVSLHTDKDGLVLVENQNEYAQVVPATSLTTAIVVEDFPSHCGFTEAEIVAGWESLRGWLAGSSQPTAAGIQQTCEALLGSVSGPCRIEPSFVIPDMDGRVRPR